jgi:hypothetical protein
VGFKKRPDLNPVLLSPDLSLIVTIGLPEYATAYRLYRACRPCTFWRIPVPSSFQQSPWTVEAVDDLRPIRMDIHRDLPRYGGLVAERLCEATERLVIFPESGRVVPEFNLDHMRETIAVVLLTGSRSTPVFLIEVRGE